MKDTKAWESVIFLAGLMLLMMTVVTMAGELIQHEVIRMKMMMIEREQYQIK